MCRGRAQPRVSGWRADPGKALGGATSGRSTVVYRNDGQLSVPVLGEPGKAWPSSPGEGLGKRSRECGPAYQLTR